MPEAVAEAMEPLSRDWRRFAEEECGAYSPLYAAISRSVAEDAELLALVAAAPRSGRQPNVLLAAVHHLLLGGLDHPLATVYAEGADPAAAPPLFRDLCLAHREEVGRLLAGRHTQTNEPGRGALLAIGLGLAAAAVGEPLGLLDAGCSGGLTLLVDRYRYDYGPAGTLGPAGSPVTTACALRGPTPVPARLPAIAARLGLDRTPLDLTDPEDARWLLACVWPDTGRLPRTAAAVELARREPPRIMTGDMVLDLDAALDTFDPGLPVVVTTTSAAGYLSLEQRHAFLATLGRRAADRALVWLTIDGVGVVPGVAVPPEFAELDTFANVMALVTFDAGVPVARSLGLCHAHGAWLWWTAG